MTISDRNTFEIENPELWYTRELSQKDRQPLYTVIFENEEEKTISFYKAPNYYNITCANNIEFKKSPIKKKLFRFFYRLKPMNIANYFYYTFN